MHKGVCSVTAGVLVQACAAGYGSAQTQGEAYADNMVTAMSKAFGTVVSQACSLCSSCKCKPLPDGWSYQDLTGMSYSAKTVAKGKYALAKTLAEAQTAYCEGGSDQTLTSSVNSVVNATGEVLIQVLMQSQIKGSAVGALASGCAGAEYSATLKGSNQAILNAFGDAAALVVGSSCPGAVSKLNKASGILKDSITKMYMAASATCVMAPQNGKKASFDVRRYVEDNVTKSSLPFAAAVADALQQGKNCGCHVGTCTFCVNPRPTTTNTTLSLPDPLGIKDKIAAAIDSKLGKTAPPTTPYVGDTTGASTAPSLAPGHAVVSQRTL